LLGLHPNYLHRLIRSLDLKPDLKLVSGECNAVKAGE